MTIIYDWFSASGLCIITEKTKVITFGYQDNPRNPNQNHGMNIDMGGYTCTLSSCKEYEYIGINIDANLNLNKMVSHTISTSSCRLSMFGKLRDSMSKAVACLVYKQTIALVLEYCGYLCNGLTTNNQQRLQLSTGMFKSKTKT